MKAPGFWSKPPGLLSLALSPIAAVYGAIATRRMSRPGETVPVPILCIGNVTVGGSGKTPTALALAAMLRREGRVPAFLTRGYGGRQPGPLVVDGARHRAADIGDEALLLAREAPTIVSRDRPAGARLAAQQGADIVVMDDGLQNPSLAKTFAVAVFDGMAGIGNGCVLPAGPLRAPLAGQWERIDAVLVMGPGKAGDRIAQEADARGLPVTRATLRARPSDRDRLMGRGILAFAGIGRPEKFFATCREAGLDIVASRSFPDHHVYNRRTISDLLDRADQAQLLPVTTEKDAVRLVAFQEVEPRIGLIATLGVEAEFADAEALMGLLRTRLAPV